MLHLIVALESFVYRAVSDDAYAGHAVIVTRINDLWRREGHAESKRAKEEERAE